MKHETPISDSVHQKTWELLPWYINNTLESPLRQLVDQHLEQCKDCRKELKEQQLLAQHVQQQDELSLSPQQSFSKLMKRIDANEQTRHDSHQSEPGSFSLLSYVRTLWTNVQQTPSPTRWILAAQTVAIVFLLGNILWVSTPLVDNTPGFETMSNGQASLITHARIRIVFSDTSTEKDIRQILTRINARIIDGPSASGVYTLAVTNGQETSREDLIEISRQLRLNHGVPFAEPVFPDHP